MFGQKFTNANKMLQCVILHYADFAPANLGQLNTAWVKFSRTRRAGQMHSHKVSGSMGSRYGVAVRGTLLVRDFYTSGQK
jgi:hypothetical protein